ncbi:unnamed protein product [Paramecium sonneborni]|uniref:non-specific serine/threonine protein kinase n=1 Tax=Paramecium sonneborni TaxID=65129 RepID=A0A8S1LGC7_9CILI|nr:unnamed protein product [Paramecium sonneborni]
MQKFQYQKVKYIGQRTCRQICLVKDVNDGSQWVQKYIDIEEMNKHEKDEMYNKFKTFQKLQHPNILKLREVNMTTEGKIFIIMEYADRGPLGEIINKQNGKQFSENQILDWFTQICLAVKYIHDHNILHQDLKSHKFYVTKNNCIKLGHFQTAKVLSHSQEKINDFVGTPYYIPPEMIEQKPYSLSADIWTLGIVFYELCMLQTPFQADSLHFLLLKICKGVFNNISPNYSTDLNNIIKQLLKCNPDQRPTINQILKFPLISKRVKEFKRSSLYQNEFTVQNLHQQRLSTDNNNTQLEFQDDQFQELDISSQKQFRTKPSTPVKNNYRIKSSKPDQQKQVQKTQISKRETSANSQKKEIKKNKKSNQVSKSKSPNQTQRSKSKKKINQIQSKKNHILQKPSDQQNEKNQDTHKLINNYSFYSQQFPPEAPSRQPKTIQQIQQKPEQQCESYEDLNDSQIQHGNKQYFFKHAKLKQLKQNDNLSEQFQPKKILIMDSEIQSEINDENEINLNSFQESDKLEKESSQSSFIGKSNRALQLKILLEQVLDVDKIQQSIKILLNEFTSKRFKDLEKQDENFYQKLLPFLSLQECKNFVPLFFQLIFLQK